MRCPVCGNLNTSHGFLYSTNALLSKRWNGSDHDAWMEAWWIAKARAALEFEPVAQEPERGEGE